VCIALLWGGFQASDVPAAVGAQANQLMSAAELGIEVPC
jgi:hypothetical protein